MRRFLFGNSLKNYARHGLICFVVLLLSAQLHASAIAAPVSSGSQEYRLRLHHLHTNESIDVVYRVGDAYNPKALHELDHFLRDHRNGAVHHFDPRLFDLLRDITEEIGVPESEIQIICGYRSPWSNKFLRRHSSGVAKHSLHMRAQAIDIRIPAVATAHLRDVALTLQRGGVGYYSQSDFVHVDVGRIRRW